MLCASPCRTVHNLPPSGVPITHAPSPRLRRNSIRLPLAANGRGVLAVLGVDLEEVVEDDHEHGRAAQEDG